MGTAVVMAAARKSSGNPELISSRRQAVGTGGFWATARGSNGQGCCVTSDSAWKGDMPSTGVAFQYDSRKMPVAVRPSSAPADEFYDLFLGHLGVLTAKGALTADNISEQLNLKKTQVTTWLQQGVREKKVRKWNRPVRYQYESRQASQQQLDLPVAVPPL